MVSIMAVWLRLELSRRWRALLVLALLVVLSTATVLTSVAGARRGATAVERLQARTLPGTAVVVPNQPHFEWDRVRALAEVAAITTFPAYTSLTILEAPNDAVTPLVPADADAMRSVERPVLLEGRLADPARPDEVVVTPAFVSNVGRGVDDALTLQLPTPEQAQSSIQAGSSEPPSGPRVRLRIVGVVRSLWWGDDVGGPGNVIPSPALLNHYRANLLGTSNSTPLNALVRLRHGRADLSAFRADLARVTGRPDLDVLDRGEYVRHAHDVTRFESACLLTFGLALLLAAAVMVGQAIARLGAVSAADLRTLGAVGLTRRQAMAMSAAAPALTALVATGVGVGLAIICSRWLPFGAASLREPNPGTDADWLVLGIAWAVVPAAVAGAAAAGAWRSLAPARRSAAHRSGVARAAATVGLPLQVVLGARFALESSLDRRAIPIRPALLGSIAGVVGVLAAFTFSAGVSDAATHPERFGRSYQLEVVFGFGGQDFSPAAPVLAALAADPDVIGVTNIRVAAGTSGATTVVTNSYDPVGKPVPIVLSDGAVPAADDEVVLAPTTARDLDATVGSSIPMRGDRSTRLLHVIGIGYAVQSSTTSYDSGAWVTPGAYDRIFGGFKEHGGLLAIRPGVDPAGLIPRLQRVGAQVQGGAGPLIFPAFVPVQVHEIDDVRVLPLVLGAFLILIAMLAVGQTLLVTLRWRTRDLAILRAIGMTPQQSRSVVITQSLVYAVTGLLVGIPIGLAVGRALWRIVAGIMPLRYEPPTAHWALLLVVPAALLAAVALGAAPGRRAARLPLADVLRTE
ncbi:MAG: putative transport system permease protein [Pseudonocardiales bacterium]|nr:putative transport system permease protein [Pseudonocardiales bacterium]